MGPARDACNEGTGMQISAGWKIGGLAALGIGAAVALAACGPSSSSKGTGPMALLSNQLMDNLHPEGYRGAQQLNLATDSTRAVTRPDGSVQGSYDGTRLLQAADSHAYGTPTIGDPAKDLKGDGIATFNEVRHVVQHFDTDGSLAFDGDENRAFEGAVGIRWIPGTS